MRILLALISLSFSIFFNQATAQQKPTEGYWMFVGIRLMEKVPKCNSRCTSVQKHWIFYENKQSYDNLRKSVNSDPRPELIFINPKIYKVIAIVKKKVDCNGQIPSFGFKAGKSKEEIIKGLDWDKQHNFFGLIDYQIEEWIDIKQELAKLSPPTDTVSDNNIKESFLDTKTVKYPNDIEIKYTIAKRADGRVVTHARVTNRSKKPVAVNFYKDGMPTQLEKANRTYLGQLGIAPNESVSHLIYTDNFTVEIGEPMEGTVLKNEKGITDRLINKIKKRLLDFIEVKEQKIQTRSASWGVRG